MRALDQLFSKHRSQVPPGFAMLIRGAVNEYLGQHIPEFDFRSFWRPPATAGVAGVLAQARHLMVEEITRLLPHLVDQIPPIDRSGPDIGRG